MPGLRPPDHGHSGKLLLTGGVSTIEGAAGGGLVPWALIGGQGTRDQVGGTVFMTRVGLDDFTLATAGVLVGIHDRIELSVARQAFDELVDDAGGKGHETGVGDWRQFG